MKNKLPFYFDSIIIFLIALFLVLGFFSSFKGLPWWHTANVVVSLLGSIPTFITMLRALAKFRITIDVFTAVALGAALYFSPDIRSAEYIILMLSSARLVDYFTQGRTKNAISALLDLKPKSARLVKGEEEVMVPLEDVKVGEIVMVQNGEKIPVDGIVEKGEALVNESSLSGESRQVLKRTKDKVFASTINENGTLYIKTEKIGKDTVLSKIIEMVQTAQVTKAPMQRTADTFAAWFLPISLAVVGGVLYFTGDVAKSIALLLVICADEIVVATPIAILAGIGQAARNGVIIKGGVHLEALSRINAIVLDKTGTLTYGRQDISFIRTFWGAGEETVISLAAMAEKHSEHSLARTIVEYARIRNIAYETPDEFEVISGKGVIAKHNGETVLVGNERFIQEHNLHIQEEISQHILDESVKGATPVIIAKGLKIIGIISITDSPRSSAKEAIKQMHDLGIKDVIMMTGDNDEVAAQTAKFLHIDSYHAQMLPEDKFKKVKEMVDGGKRVIMVGDGVNDAPALSIADVGIAMGVIGTDVAIEAADIALMNDQLEKIPEVIALSRRVMNVIKGNIFLWIAFNVVGMTLVFIGIIGPVGAALYNFLTDFIPLGNSLRLFKRERKTQF